MYMCVCVCVCMYIGMQKKNTSFKSTSIITCIVNKLGLRPIM